MNYKQEIKTQLSHLKAMGKSRRQIEKDIGYSDKYIDQSLARGGNESLLNALSNYKNNLEDGERNILKEEAVAYLTKDQYIKKLEKDLSICYELIDQLKKQIVEIQPAPKGKAGGHCPESNS